jgi:hypothetical protein
VTPARCPRDIPMLRTMRLSGPGDTVSSTAAARKGRIWVVSNMAAS